MSTDASTPTDDEEKRSLRDLCESISEDEEYSDDVRFLADGLLDAIKRGDVDAT